MDQLQSVQRCAAARGPGRVYRAEMGQKDHKTQQLEIEQQRVDLRFAVIQKLCLQELEVVFRNYSSYSETVRNYFGIYRNYSVVFRNYRLGLGSL